MGRITGLEPATFGTTNQRSNQLSYIRHTESLLNHSKFVVELIGLEPTRCVLHVIKCPNQVLCNFGGADRTRTDEMRVACHQVSQPGPLQLWWS